MRIRWKLLLAVGTSFLLVTAGLALFFATFVQSEYSRVELEFVEKDLERVKLAIESKESSLAKQTDEWAKWDDTYQFMVDGSQEYKDKNLSFESLSALDIRYIVYFQLNRKVFDGWQVDAETTLLQQLVNDEIVVFEGTQAIQTIDGGKGYSSGLLRIKDRIILFAATEIQDNTMQSPARGILLRGADFFPKIRDELSLQTRLNLEAYPVGDTELPADVRTATAELISSGKSRIVIPRGDNLLESYLLLSDVSGRPGLIFKVRSERPIFAQSQKAKKSIVTILVAAGFIAVFLLYIVINRSLVSRVESISSQMNSIRSSDQIGAHIDLPGTDELSTLSDDINNMLASLESSHKETVLAKNDAERANAAKSMFIARVSHELRTPVGGIVGINRIIKKQEGLSRSIIELVDMGDRTAHGLLSIIDEILDFAKAESGELTFEKIPFDLRQSVRETMQAIAGRLEGKYKPEDSERVQLICSISPTVPAEIVGDPTKLKQILTNLLGNAVKFTQAGYISLNIEAEQFANSQFMLRFEIADTGVGIPEEKLGAVFEPFKQADASVTRKYQGTGLGLSIVKQFADGLGGTVSVSSKKGAGTVFTVVIPFESAAAERLLSVSGVRRQQATLGRLPKRSTLVAVDSAVSQSMAKSLGELGAKDAQLIDPFKSTEEGMVKTLQETDLLVISEEAFEMPGISAAIKARLAANKGCTVAMLRPSSVTLRDALYADGLEYVLPTPVLADDLLLAYSGELLKAVNSNREAGAVVEELASPQRALNVLIVDDLPTNRIILEDMLEEGGHRFKSVSDGTEMVELLSAMIKGEAGAERFDVVLTDVSMAIMNGDEATKAVRELESQFGVEKQIPIFAVTAHAFVEEHERIAAAGVNGVLLKPVSPEKVAQIFAGLESPGVEKKNPREGLSAQPEGPSY